MVRFTKINLTEVPNLGFSIRNSVMTLAKPGDTMFITTNGQTLLVIITPSDSTIERQLHWLFDLENSQSGGYQLSEIDVHRIGFRCEVHSWGVGNWDRRAENDRIDQLLSNINYRFLTPFTFQISARQKSCRTTNMIEEPDNGILLLMEWEEKLFNDLSVTCFKTSSRRFTTEGNGRCGRVSRFSLSVPKSPQKAEGWSSFRKITWLIFWLKIILFFQKLKQKIKRNPIFLFPNIECYRNNSFPVENLHVIRVWRRHARIGGDKYLVSLKKKGKSSYTWTGN